MENIVKKINLALLAATLMGASSNMYASGKILSNEDYSKLMSKMKDQKLDKLRADILSGRRVEEIREQKRMKEQAVEEKKVAKKLKEEAENIANANFEIEYTLSQAREILSPAIIEKYKNAYHKESTNTSLYEEIEPIIRHIKERDETFDVLRLAERKNTVELRGPFMAMLRRLTPCAHFNKIERGFSEIYRATCIMDLYKSIAALDNPDLQRKALDSVASYFKDFDRIDLFVGIRLNQIMAYVNSSLKVHQ